MPGITGLAVTAAQLPGHPRRPDHRLVLHPPDTAGPYPGLAELTATGPSSGTGSAKPAAPTRPRPELAKWASLAARAVSIVIGSSTSCTSRNTPPNLTQSSSPCKGDFPWYQGHPLGDPVHRQGARGDSCLGNMSVAPTR